MGNHTPSPELYHVSGRASDGMTAIILSNSTSGGSFHCTGKQSWQIRVLDSPLICQCQCWAFVLYTVAMMTDAFLGRAPKTPPVLPLCHTPAQISTP
jgi:hypothetical protein